MIMIWLLIILRYWIRDYQAMGERPTFRMKQPF